MTAMRSVTLSLCLLAACGAAPPPTPLVACDVELDTATGAVRELVRDDPAMAPCPAPRVCWARSDGADAVYGDGRAVRYWSGVCAVPCAGDADCPSGETCRTRSDTHANVRRVCAAP